MSILLNGYLTAQELADQLGVKKSTVDRWRRLRIGAPWSYKGKTPITRGNDWQEWLRAGGFKSRQSRKLRRTNHAREDHPIT